MIKEFRDKIKAIFFPIKKSIGRTLGTGISAQINTNYGSNYGSGSKYPGGIGNPRPIVSHDHYAIRQQVREAMYDSVELRSLVTTQVDTVVDSGLKLKPTPVASMLGITPEAAEEWAEDVATRFHLWASSKKSHRSRVNNFYQNQRWYQLFQQRDNDVFTRLYYGRDKDSLNPLQIEFLETNQIRGYGNTNTYGNFNADDGIVRDGAGREIAYKIWTFDVQTGKYTEQTIPAVGEKSGRIMMLHGFNPEYAGQTRGYSNKAHLIQELSDLTDFKQSIIQKAINQASMVAAVENQRQDPSNPLINRVAAPIREYGSNPIPSSEAHNVTAESLEPVINWDVTPEATIRQPGSMLIGNMRAGDTLKFLQDTSPSASFDMFVNSVFSFLAASTGYGIELILKKFGQNYSASRGTLLLCWRKAIIDRLEMAGDFLDPVYEMWLSEEIASGRIQAFGWADPQMKAAWLCSEWAGTPMPNIDPNSTAKADQMYVEMGAQTLDDVARNLNGSSGKANRIKNARQLEELSPVPWNKQVQMADTEEQKTDEDSANG
jgi:lambda family phage portal protein